MPDNWKIYTRKGDKGETSLIGGRRVPKSDLRIEAYGDLDELNAFTGLLRDELTHEGLRATLLSIQERLFVAESMLATDPGQDVADGLPLLQNEDSIFLEQAIDHMNGSLPTLVHFILPGGSRSVSLAHVCRTVCRRAERSAVALAMHGQVPPMVIEYINRLSDYFFVLARYLSQLQGADEIIWKGRMS